MKSPPNIDLLRSVRAFVEKHHMFERGYKVIAAVSGGPDSMALLHVLARLRPVMGLEIVVAHLDHGLRDDSARDADFTRDACQALAISTVIQRTDVRTWSRQRGVSIEEAGREARYAFFEDVRKSVNGDVIATGHHMDDEIETVFLRMFRGTSPKGLRGIARVRDRVVRPLLCATRQDIMTFLESEKIRFRVDPTNLQDNTDRNFVRNRLIPLIKERFPDFGEPMRRSMDILRHEERVLDQLAAEFAHEAVSRTGGGLSIAGEKVRSGNEAVAARLIMKALHEIGGPEARWQRSHVVAILQLIQSGNPSGRIHLPAGVTAWRQYDALLLDRTAAVIEGIPVLTVSGPGTVAVPSADMTLGFSVRPKSEVRPEDLDGRSLVVFDADQVNFPFTVRGPMPGDRFRPWGFDGTRKLKKVLIDAKIPLRVRNRVPLVIRGATIVWIPHLRRSDDAPVTETTEFVVKMEIVP